MYLTVLQECNRSQAKLVAVSKYRTMEEIMNLYQQGQRIFGENRVQDLILKKKAFPKDIEWHLIGSLQKNKVKMIVGEVALMHGIDNIELLQKVDEACQQKGCIQNVLLQVNISEEPQKHGFSLENFLENWEKIKPLDLRHVRIKGLMGMAILTEDESLIKCQFVALKSLYDGINTKDGHCFEILSMGMSADYPIALACGATHVRIGSKLFEE